MVTKLQSYEHCNEVTQATKADTLLAVVGWDEVNDWVVT